MNRKKCSNPACCQVYIEAQSEYADGYCNCGFQLEQEHAAVPSAKEPTPKRETPPSGPKTGKNAPSQTRVKPRTPPKVGRDGKILLPGDSGYPQAGTSAYRAEIAVFVGGREVLVRTLHYDETLVGRTGRGVSPDIDLSAHDPEERLSRRHLQIVRSEGHYFARNFSKQKAVHLNGVPLRSGEQRELADGDEIVLSEFVGIEFRLREG